MKNLEIFNNFASDIGGGLYVEASSQIYMDNCNFFNNFGVSAGALYIYTSNYIYFNNSQIKNNYGQNQAGGIYLQSTSNVHFYNLIIDSNQTPILSGGIYLVKVTDGYFQKLNITNNYAFLNGGGIYADGGYNLNIFDTYFANNSVSTNVGGGILMVSSNTIDIYNCTFESNLSFQYGGAISIKNTNLVKINQNKFYNNFCAISGGAIDFEVTEGSITNSEFYKNRAIEKAGALIVRKIQSCFISNSTFVNNYVDDEGGSLYLSYLKKIDIQYCQFKNNSASKGGSAAMNNLQWINIKNTNFYDNFASSLGGALYMLQNLEANFENVDFINNFLKYIIGQKQSGGAIYINQITSMQLKYSNFEKNKAYLEGGGLWLLNVINLIIIDSKFKQNTVYFQQDQKRSEKSLNYILSKLENIDISQDNADIGIIRYLGPQLDIMDGVENKISNKNGKNNLEVYTQQLVTSGYKDNEKLINENKFDFELCTQGSVLIGGGQTLCNVCQEHGKCQGGYRYNYPDKGYWRFNQSESKYYQCTHVDQTCLGNDICKEGYTGILCEQCDFEKGYRLNMFKNCEFCSDNKFYEISFIIFVYLAYVCILTYTTHKVKQRVDQGLLKKYLIHWGKVINFQNNSSQITKIFIMHLQITYLLQPDYVSLPTFAQGLLNNLTNPQSSMSSSITCYQENLRKQLKESKVSFDQTNFSYILSVIMIFSVLLVNILNQLQEIKRKKYKKILGQSINILIVCFITQQSGWIDQNLNFLMCKTLGDIKYTYYDVSIQCDTDFYTNQVLPLNLVLFTFFCILIPLFLAQRLYLNKKNLEQYHFKIKYGYLYIEFKKTAYLWEFVSMFEKKTMKIWARIRQKCRNLFEILKKNPYILQKIDRQMLFYYSQDKTMLSNLMKGDFEYINQELFNICAINQIKKYKSQDEIIQKTMKYTMKIMKIGLNSFETNQTIKQHNFSQEKTQIIINKDEQKQLLPSFSITTFTPNSTNRQLMSNTRAQIINQSTLSYIANKNYLEKQSLTPINIIEESTKKYNFSQKIGRLSNSQFTNQENNKSLFTNNLSKNQQYRKFSDNIFDIKNSFNPNYSTKIKIQKINDEYQNSVDTANSYNQWETNQLQKDFSPTKNNNSHYLSAKTIRELQQDQDSNRYKRIIIDCPNQRQFVNYNYQQQYQNLIQNQNQDSQTSFGKLSPVKVQQNSEIFEENFNSVSKRDDFCDISENQLYFKQFEDSNFDIDLVDDSVQKLK